MLVAGLLVAIQSPSAAQSPREEGVALFQDQIVPLLERRCYECHSHKAGEANGGLVLDSKSGWEKGGVSGPAIVPGMPEHSLLMRAVAYDDPKLKMPPDGKLSADEAGYLQKWIALGAADPRTAPDAVQTGGVRPLNALELWSVRPVVRPELPEVQNRDWPQEAIDRFILVQLEARKLTPGHDAEPEQLLRRLYFDLIGLPPEPEAIASFRRQVRLDRRRAIEDIVDQLLASPHFGERWGRHWLDVARYAETNGLAWNMTLPYAWRYRDYVIGAMNADKPYHRFIAEQLAGDLMPSTSDVERREQLIATGFLAIGSKPLYEKEAELSGDQLEWVDDQINTTSRAMLGLTVSCARCHDHKFDPIAQSDYYALAGIFYSTRMLKELGTKGGEITLQRRPLVPQAEADKYTEQVKQIAEVTAKLAELDKQTPKPPPTDPARVALVERRDQLQKELPPAPPMTLAVSEGGRPRRSLPGNSGCPDSRARELHPARLDRA
ncbi:MAG: DUF1549 domain-containing protein, partial [Burkholderiaceae bacterium]|nr:DUF1549 domain-containing protein [Burkholderiaceae bacterium]